MVIQLSLEQFFGNIFAWMFLGLIFVQTCRSIPLHLCVRLITLLQISISIGLSKTGWCSKSMVSYNVALQVDGQ